MAGIMVSLLVAPQIATEIESLSALLMIHCTVPLQGNGIEHQDAYWTVHWHIESWK